MASAHPPTNGNGNGGGHGPAIGEHSFGTCCDALAEVLETQEFSPTFAVEETGVLFMAVGCAEVEPEGDEDEGGIAWFDQAVMFCPFCGTQLQTQEDIESKIDEDELV